MMNKMRMSRKNGIMLYGIKRYKVAKGNSRSVDGDRGKMNQNVNDTGSGLR